MLFNKDELEEATQLVHRFIPPTPQYVWPQICDPTVCLATDLRKGRRYGMGEARKPYTNRRIQNSWRNNLY